MSASRQKRPLKSDVGKSSIEQPLSKLLSGELTDHDRMEIKARIEIIEKAINLLRAECLARLSDESGPESVLGLWAKQRHYQELVLELKILARVL